MTKIAKILYTCSIPCTSWRPCKVWVSLGLCHDHVGLGWHKFREWLQERRWIGQFQEVSQMGHWLSEQGLWEQWCSGSTGNDDELNSWNFMASFKAFFRGFLTVLVLLKVTSKPWKISKKYLTVINNLGHKLSAIVAKFVFYDSETYLNRKSAWIGTVIK